MLDPRCKLFMSDFFLPFKISKRGQRAYAIPGGSAFARSYLRSLAGIPFGGLRLLAGQVPPAS